MKKLISGMAVLGLLLYYCSFTTPVYGGINYMPANPEVYPELYEKSKPEAGIMRASVAYPMPRIEEAADIERIPAAGAVEKVLVIPIEFTDEKFDAGHDKKYFEAILAKMGDYYRVNSQYDGTKGKGMSIDATVVDVVYSDYTMADYGRDGSDIDNFYSYTQVQELAREAVIKADALVDFSNYDNDGDGFVDHLFIIHAGMGQEEANISDLIWSHRWSIGGGEEVDGVYAYNYATVPETGQLGTFAHEFGHDIGLPDLYDTDYGSNGETEGVGDWDVMGTGSWNRRTGELAGSTPANLSAWSRMYMGWTTPEIITQNGNKTLTTNADGISSILKFWTDGNTEGKEYYLSEYRGKKGYDAGLPGEGMLIWHIDQEQIALQFGENAINAYETRLGVELEQADAYWDLWKTNNRGDAGDPFPGTSNNKNFTAVPYKFNYSNINTSQFNYAAVSNISLDASTSTASADYYVGTSYPTVPIVSKPEDSTVVSTTPTFGWGVSPQAEYFKLQLSKDPNFVSDHKEYSFVKESDGISYSGNGYEFTIPALDALTPDFLYYWRVVGLNGQSNDTNVQWTSNQRITTVSAYVPGMTAPEVSFSFDGENAGRLMGITTAMGYNLSGGDEYTQATLDNQLLTQDQIAALTAEGNIKVKLLSGAGAIKYIDILPGPVAPVFADDSNDIIKNIDNTMEFSIDNTNWTRYSNNLPDLTGYITIYVRVAATGCTLTGEAKSISFTKTIPAPMVSFSFDGDNAERLMGITTAMEYSLDGGLSYIPAVENGQLLTPAQLIAITAENDLKVRVKATDIDVAGNVLNIDILPKPAAPAVVADDYSNMVQGINNTMEFSVDNANWTKYNSNLPNLSSYITLYIRVAATGCTLPGEVKSISFTPAVVNPPAPPTGGGGGGGGGGGTGFVLPVSIADAGVIVSSSSLINQINDANKTEVAIVIPKDAKEQSMAIYTSDLKKLNGKNKGLTISSGNVKLTLMPNSISEQQLTSIGETSQLKLSIKEVDSQQAVLSSGQRLQNSNGLFMVGNRLFEFHAELLAKDKSQTVIGFDAPVRITIDLKALGLSNVDIEKLGVYNYNENTKTWDYLGGNYDAATGTISFETPHFSYYSVMEYKKTFTDITKHWGKDYIEKMAAKYIAKGENGSFRPDDSISRAEFTALLVRSLGLKDGGKAASASFTDVSEEKWYTSEVSKAYSSGIVKKEDGVTFRPDIEITREEIVVMVARALQYKELAEKPSAEQIKQALGNYSDYEQISETAREAFAIALKKGIVKGRTADTIAPKGNATRAEAIVMIYRLLSIK